MQIESTWKCTRIFMIIAVLTATFVTVKVARGIV